MDVSTVLVDVGTGFYVEKSTADAQDFYKRKIEDLGRNLKELEAIVQGKGKNLSVVEEGGLHVSFSSDLQGGPGRAREGGPLELETWDVWEVAMAGVGGRTDG